MASVDYIYHEHCMDIHKKCGKNFLLKRKSLALKEYYQVLKDELCIKADYEIVQFMSWRWTGTLKLWFIAKLNESRKDYIKTWI